MNKLKKSLSVLLTLVMLFTTFCFFPLDLGAIEADAAIAGIKIVVPETIYLTPSTGASTTGQYYVNNNADGSVKTAYDTTASVSVTYPGATLKSVSAATTAAANIGAITGLNGTTLGSSAATASSAITLGAGLNAGGTALVEWTFVFDVNGQTRTHYAYSVAYSPWYQPVGAAAKAKGAYHNTYASSILWVSGVHGYADGDSNSRWYIQTANFIPMLGTIKAPGNNNPETNWIQSDSNGLSPTVNYQSVEAGGTKYHARANSISPTANLTVDTSRYNNFNQIPNFSVGFMVTDRENANEGPNWYVSDFTGQTSSYYNGTATGSSEYSGDFNSAGTQFSSGNDSSTGIKYNGTWNKAISGTASFRIKSAVKTKTNKVIDSTAWNNNFVNISVTGANKSTLRTKVMEGTSYAKENYTADTWNTYYSALKAAATNLGNPTSATVDTSALTTAESELMTTAYFNANGGSLGSTPSSVPFTIGGVSSVAFPQSTLISAYPATRTGYTFLGWAKDKNATSAPDSLSVGFNETVYAVWQANSYDVVFDNLIKVKNWSKSASNATISFNSDYSEITLTSNNGAGEGTSESPEFPVTAGRQYKIDIDFEGDNWDIYIFFRNATTGGTGIEFADNETRRYSSNGSTGVDPENAVFTAPAGATKAVIRLDANGSNNTVKFKNVRVYEAGSGSDSASYKPVTAYKYDSIYGNALPTPTKTGYVFKGWVDENGNAVAADAKVDFTEAKHLYSTWEIGKFTVTFDTDGGSAVSPITGNYGSVVTAPANPTKTGYTFAGWDREIPGTIPAENITIKAKWNVNQYTITFDTDGGSAVAPITQDFGTAVTAPAAPTKTGYTFAGWENLPATMPAGNMTVKAKWTINQYTITFDTDGGSTVNPITQDFGTAVTAPAAPTKTGYTFAGWDVAVPGTMPAENITIKAKWNVNQYTITFDTDGGSAVDAITQDFGTAVTAPAAPTKEGYTFAGWSVEVPETMPAENITIKALWTINQYTITFDTDGGSAVDAITQDFGTAVTAPAAPTKTGYTFAGWENLPSTMPSSNITVKAKWTVNQYTITFDSNGGSSVPSITQDYGTAVTAPAVPTMTGYTFVSWYPALPETMPAENITLTAQWTINLYDVTFKFFDKDGTEITVVRTDVPHGTAFSSLGLPTAAEGFIDTYYNGAVAEPENNTHHYIFSAWKNTVENITEDITFEATYTEDVHKYFDNGSVAANCIDTGIEAKACDCGYSYSKVTPSLGHNWTETGRTEYCTANGTVDYKCSRCPATKQETIPAVGHKFSDVTAKQEPNCTEVGYEAYKTCTVCNLYFAADADAFAEGSQTKTEIPANGHDYGDLIAEVPATCEGTGVIAHYICSVCSVNFDENKNVVTDLVIPAQGHGYGEWIEEVPADCDNEGTKGHYHCDACDKNFDAEKNELADLVIPAAGHDYGELIAEIPATCVATGTKAHYTCSVCSVNFDENKAVLDSLVIDINSDNHDLVTVDAKAPTCEDIGWDAYEYCQREGCEHSTYVEKPATDHDYKSTVTKPATCITDGEMTYTCSNDSTHTYTVDIVAEGHKFINEVAYKAPGCLVDGNEAYKECSVCNKYFAGEEGIFSENANDSADVFTLVHTGHTEAKKQVVINEATCTVAGDYWDITYCSVCETEITRVQITGQTLPHTYTEQIIDEAHLKEAATCVKYAVYYYDCIDCTANAKDVDGATFEYAEGGYDATKHVGTTTTADEDFVAGTCIKESTWNEVTRCDDCNEIITSVPKTGEIDENNHVGETYKQDEDIVDGTCTSVKTWNEVTYCADCDTELSTVAKTGEKDPANHSTTETVLKNDKAATCCEKGYTGDMHCADCDAIVTYGEEIIENKENHAGGTRVEKEDVVSGTCAAPETWNDVTYCVGCGEKLGTVAQTGEIDEDNHAGETRVEKINEVAGTCETEATWTEVTYCADCGDEISREDKTGEKNPANHTGETYIEKINEVAGTCEAEATWTEITYCKGCDVELGRIDKTGEKDPEKHTGETYLKEENVVPGTCISEKTWDEVTYCKGCDTKLGTVQKTGDKDENNHEGTADKIVGYVAPTCKEEGYTGDTLYSCCDKLYAAGTAIPTVDHTPAEAVRENEIPATETEDGSYESVVYCSVCGEEISRETVSVKLERTITFVMKDKTVEVKAFNGDIVNLPDVADYTGANGFIYKFKAWDKPVAVVNGDATYIAVYTEPCDYSELDALEEILKEVLEGDLVDSSVLEENKTKIEDILRQIENINKDRNIRDKADQSIVDFVTDGISDLIDIIYPDAGSTLVIEGSSVAYVGTVLDLKAVKMPLGAVLTNAEWVSSDDSIVFFANGKLYAIGTGTVTLTVTRGTLKASKTVTVIEGGNTRGINFTSINNTHFIIEDYKAVYNSSIIYWSDDFDLRFKVRVYQSFMFEDYIVYINDVEVEPDANGYYVIPAGSGDARVTIAGEMIGTGDGNGEVVTKWSFWEWLLNFFRKIADFFRNLFN